MRLSQPTSSVPPSLPTENHVILTVVTALFVVGLILVNVPKVCLSSPRARFLSGMSPGCSLPPLEHFMYQLGMHRVNICPKRIGASRGFCFSYEVPAP